jgi:hypothetical protein
LNGTALCALVAAKLQQYWSGGVESLLKGKDKTRVCARPNTASWTLVAEDSGTAHEDDHLTFKLY